MYVVAVTDSAKVGEAIWLTFGVSIGDRSKKVDNGTSWTSGLSGSART